MGGSNIQAKFEQYQRQYPLYRRDAIVDIMLKDGVITPEIAKKIKSGTSIFIIDNPTFGNSQIDSDFSMTKIFGGDFSTKKSNRQPKPSTNTKQYSKIAPELLVDNKGKIDVKQFSLEALKKKYDSKNYTIKKVDSEFVNGTYNYEIRDKKNNLICLIKTHNKIKGNK